MAEGKSCCVPQRESSSIPMHGGCCRPQAPANGANTKGMRLLDGGTFLMGSDSGTYPEDGEGPVREVRLAPFYIDIASVTNKQFDRFIKATGYKTEAEQFGWSFVFHLLIPPDTSAKLKQHVPGLDWWWKVPGAYWRRPEGRESTVADRMDRPAVHVSWNDSRAYAKWARKRLPTEAEYEYAARGGLEQNTYPWGDELTPNGEHRCNIWQGAFPTTNTQEDGYLGTAPARSFPPNGYGLFNMAGNVWEWCWDWFNPTFHVDGPRENPLGPNQGVAKVMRGGSYLCHESYCNRYRVSARTGNTPDSSTGNMGFRCVVDAT
jgi:formylglycine-generating enzyme required for sulfatase activity